ncbi:hypothetical protein [Helicobacter typhlonius]|uniref:hypothetical protein n=1 Tax=Helicobacter typhlonius TaxID=76936 RepID=UPI002FE017D4
MPLALSISHFLTDNLRYPLYLFYEQDYKRALHKHENITLNTLKEKTRFCNFIVSNDKADNLSLNL